MSRRIYTFSLRPKRDADIMQELEKIEGGDCSSVIRKALRKLLVSDKRENVIQKEPEKKETIKPVTWDFPKG